MAVQTQGFTVSKENSQKVFSALGEENWWKQLYDGKYQHLGPKVFDEGLHGRAKEPGFYESARKAFQYAKAHLNEKVNLEFYCNLHKEACAHFKGKENNTRMKANEAGHFRTTENKGVECGFKISEIMEVFDRNRTPNDSLRKNVITDYAIVKNHYMEKAIETIADNKTLHDKDNLARNFTITVEEAKEIESLIESKIKAAQETLACCQDPILKNAMPGFAFSEDGVKISYKEPKFHNFVFEIVISHLFETFNRSVAEIDEQLSSSKNQQALIHKKLILIADLYQKLEWLHPFQDGQGRTNLLLLSKLLAEHGFTPAILDEPYMSSFSSLEDWVAYLIEGMQKWQKEAQLIN